MEKMVEAAMKKDVETLMTAARMIGGGFVSAELRLSRAAILHAIEAKTSGEFVDSFTDELGM